MGDVMVDPILPPAGQYLREEAVRGGMDLLFFINTRHLKRADAKLAELGLGRAHHRGLYFVARNPGLTVSRLLELLSVTKQSLGRISKDLTTRGLLEVRVGDRDRRTRLMQLTTEGAALERDLFQELHDNVARAYGECGSEAVTGFWLFAQSLIGEEGRAQFRRMQIGGV
ncbi:MAG: MarR family winged helix-turn-helix transcriptional regulator [Sphingomonas sp.]|uniref:MarR family winged helix-turn-helix transcriptional regulator n=1 Tax=Sphingomonas sp. TaxID=28214 RepID=UPI003F7F77EA